MQNVARNKKTARTQIDSILPEIQYGRYWDGEPIPQDLIRGCLVLEDIMKRHPHLQIDNSHSDSGVSYAISRKRTDYDTPLVGEDYWRHQNILEVFPRYKGGDGKTLPTVVYFIRDHRWVTEIEITPVEELVKNRLQFEVVNKVERIKTLGHCTSPRTGKAWKLPTFYMLLDVMDIHQMLKTIFK